MVIKKLFLLLILFPLCLSFVFAQTETEVDHNVPPEQEGELNFFIDSSGEEPRFIQRLIWEAGDYVFRYEVIIERMEQTGYEEVERVSVEQNFAEVSLTAGLYRFRVEVYDLFDEFAYVTSLQEFEIIRAIQPELSSFSPRIFYLDEDEVWEINVRGQNLLPNSVFYLLNNNTRINTIAASIEETSALLVFSGNALVPGEYNIYVRNPGGLDAHLGQFTITNRKLTDFNISVGFAPIVPLYGYLFKDSDQEAPFPGSFYPLGLSARVSFVPIKRVWGSLGIEASGSFSILEEEKDFYTTSTSLLNAHLSLLYQKYFLKRAFSINVSVGAGITSLLNFKYEYQSGVSTEDITSTFFSAIAGLSVSVFVNKMVFFSAGADYLHVFTVFSPLGDSPMPGFIRPFISAGIQF